MQTGRQAAQGSAGRPPRRGRRALRPEPLSRRGSNVSHQGRLRNAEERRPQDTPTVRASSGPQPWSRLSCRPSARWGKLSTKKRDPGAPQSLTRGARSDGRTFLVPHRSWIAKILNAPPTRWLRERKGRLRAFAFQMKHNPALRGGRATDRREGSQASAAAEPYPEPRGKFPE